jgi:hypothetical protein
MHRAIQMWVVQEIPAEEEVWDTAIRRLVDSGVNKKLVQGRLQKVAINLFVRFDLCTTNPKE